ncbi:MAG: ABC transporter permease, partial [Flavobacterium sp.]|nr:ABC transporter permease [Pedobacter sp.]
LIKHKLFSLINIFGLASGMTVCILALTHIKGAYDYDTFHPDAERSYRVITNLNFKDGRHMLAASSPLPLGDYLKSNYKTTIDKCTRVYFSYDEVTANNKNLNAKEAYVDADFYKIFGFKLLSGSPATAPQTVVLTGETAKRFFGKENPIGQTISIGKSGEYMVTGILAEPKYQSHLKFDLLASIPIGLDKQFLDWSDEAAGYTYVQLKHNVEPSVLHPILQNATKEANRLMRPSANKSYVFEAQALTKITPAMRPIYNIAAGPAFPNLIAFASIGLFILLLAFFNYINLTLARSLDRAREVGIRKVAGALKHHLLLQFLSESVLIALLAFGLAQLQLKLISTLPVVQNLTGSVSHDTTLWGFLILFTIITGLLAGWIPAQVLSSFQPVRVLKGRFNVKLFGGAGLRKSLTVIQFSASLIALVSLLVFYKQSEYMATADYGFNRERILNIPLQANSYERTATALAATAGVEQASATSSLFGYSGADNKFIKPENSNDSLSADYFSVTPSFITIMGITFVAGQNLPVSSSGNATRYVVINEEASRQLQFKNSFESVGKLIRVNDSTKYRVSGVVKDFHYASFKRSIKPLLLTNNPDEFKTLSLKIEKGAEQTIISRLNLRWKKLYPNQPFEKRWLDNELYQQHLHKSDLIFVGLLTGMALSIACLGLLGMVICTSKNRLKEVGIRRVLGAGAWQIVFVISKEFIVLMFISICIGLPLGFLTGSQFLQQYAYRIPISLEILAGSALTLICLGGLTIGWQTYRTALANPVKSLRME